MSPSSRTEVLATVEQLAFNLEDTIGTLRSINNSSHWLTLTERMWIAYLEEQVHLWVGRLNRVDMFQPTLWDGH